MVLPERTFQAATYKRAVYCRAKASLLTQFATVTRRESAENPARNCPNARKPSWSSANRCAFAAGPWPHHGGAAVIKLRALTAYLIERQLVLPSSSTAGPTRSTSS
jgi:hypothetical protein